MKASRYCLPCILVYSTVSHDQKPTLHICTQSLTDERQKKSSLFFQTQQSSLTSQYEWAETKEKIATSCAVLKTAVLKSSFRVRVRKKTQRKRLALKQSAKLLDDAIYNQISVEISRKPCCHIKLCIQRSQPHKNAPLHQL